MSDVILDALIDSLKVLGVSIVIYILLSFVEDKISRLFVKHKNVSPLIGASTGLIPQCGISVVAADMYQKEHITAGALMAVFFACSDEAFPILLTNVNKMIYIIPLIILKFVFGCILGYIVDLILKRKNLKEVTSEIHVGCCQHEIDNKDEKPFHKHLLHPLVHSLKIWLYVFIINILFGIMVYCIGEESILSFLDSNVFLGPILAGIIGLVPNCASSVLMTELFIMDGLSFGALFTGLCVNAGLGVIYLLKFKKQRINALKMMLTLFIYSVCIGYVILLIMRLF